ncbi:MAG: hypothetical protein GOV00_00690 [Candidatus Altiarchaeota archaeon]|nr:hypothetical protein [Candidatus Altiarchaeota archaeon]
MAGNESQYVQTETGPNMPSNKDSKSKLKSVLKAAYAGALVTVFATTIDLLSNYQLDGPESRVISGLNLLSFGLIAKATGNGSAQYKEL